MIVKIIDELINENYANEFHLCSFLIFKFLIGQHFDAKLGEPGRLDVGVDVDVEVEVEVDVTDVHVDGHVFVDWGTAGFDVGFG